MDVSPPCEGRITLRGSLLFAFRFSRSTRPRGSILSDRIPLLMISGGVLVFAVICSVRFSRSLALNLRSSLSLSHYVVYLLCFSNFQTNPFRLENDPTSSFCTPPPPQENKGTIGTNSLRLGENVRRAGLINVNLALSETARSRASR